MSKVLFQVVVVWTLWVASGRAQSDALLSARLVNVPAQPCLTAGGPSYAPQFSSDGRYLYFISSAANLTTNRKISACLDLYKRDLERGTTTLVSVSTNGTGGDGNSFSPSTSSNNQFVAFISQAHNFVPSTFTNFGSFGDLGAELKGNVFLFDAIKGTNQLVNQNPTNDNSVFFPVGFECKNLHLSDDGQALAFQSKEYPPARYNNTFWWHSLLQSNVLVNNPITWPYPIQTADSHLFGLSVGGGRVLLETALAVADQSNAISHLFLVSMPPQTNQATPVYWVTSDASIMVPGYYGCTNAAMPPAADWVAYLAVTASNASQATLVLKNTTDESVHVLSTNCLVQSTLNISDDGLHLLVQELEGHCLYDLSNGQRTLLSNPVQGAIYHPVLSSNGKRVAFFAADPARSEGVGSETCHLISYDVPSGRYSTILSNVLSVEQLLSPPAISGDGQQIALETPNATLVANDFNRGSDVFWMATETGAIQCVSMADASLPSTGSGGLIQPGKVVSFDGRRVAFVASDSNFVPGDTNLVGDLLVRDMTTQTNWLVSRDEPREDCLLLGIKGFMLSTNGERAAYIRQFKTNDQVAHLLVCREIESGLIVTSFWAEIQFQSMALSPSGHRLAFCTKEALTGDFPVQTNAQAFLWDDLTGTTRMISVSRTNGLPASKPCSAVEFLPNEKAVLFGSMAPELYDRGYFNLNSYGLYRYNLASNYLTGAASGMSSPPALRLSITPNSRFVVWQALRWDYISVIDLEGPSSSDNLRNTLCAIDNNYSWLAYVMTGRVFLKDRLRQYSYECGPSSQTSSSGSAFVLPVMTSDGRFVAYADIHKRLDRTHTNGIMRVLLYDQLLRNSIVLQEAFPTDASIQGRSMEPVFSGDNQTLTITTGPSEIIGSPLNQCLSLFQVRLVNDDTDHDGLNDAWELAFFGSLEQAANGDFDHDGMSNLQELQAGTNPASGTSRLAATILVDSLTSSSTLAWQATPGTAYRIEYKNGLQDPSWRVLKSNLLAQAKQEVYVDPAPATNRFYRLIVLP